MKYLLLKNAGNTMLQLPVYWYFPVTNEEFFALYCNTQESGKKINLGRSFQGTMDLLLKVAVVVLPVPVALAVCLTVGISKYKLASMVKKRSDLYLKITYCFYYLNRPVLINP